MSVLNYDFIWDWAAVLFLSEKVRFFINVSRGNYKADYIIKARKFSSLVSQVVLATSLGATTEAPDLGSESRPRHELVPKLGPNLGTWAGIWAWDMSSEPELESKLGRELKPQLGPELGPKLPAELHSHSRPNPQRHPHSPTPSYSHRPEPMSKLRSQLRSQLTSQAHIPAQVQSCGPKLYSQGQETLRFRRDIWLLVFPRRTL
jgi:hypothetical protein